MGIPARDIEIHARGIGIPVRGIGIHGHGIRNHVRGMAAIQEIMLDQAARRIMPTPQEIMTSQ